MIDVRCPLCKNRYSCKQMGMIPLENCGMFVIDDTIKRHKTNADRIRAMTDEELAKYISNRPQCPDKEKYGFDPRSERCDYGYDCDECWIDWIKQEADTDDKSD